VITEDLFVSIESKFAIFYSKFLSCSTILSDC